jgi:hypothetical protein
VSAELVTKALCAYCPGGSGEKLVLVILANHLNHQTGRCFPSIATIARQAGFKTHNAVYKYLRSLELLGHITRTSGGGKTTNRYQVHPKEMSMAVGGRLENAQDEDCPANLKCGLKEEEDENQAQTPLPQKRGGKVRPSSTGEGCPLPRETVPLFFRRGEQEVTGKKTTKSLTRPADCLSSSATHEDAVPFHSVQFTAAWNEWKQHRKEKRKPITPTTQFRQFKTFREWGEQRTIAAIQNSIEKGWTGIFEPKNSRQSFASISSGNITQWNPL